MPVLCSSCADKRAVLKRPKTGHSLCKECFFWAFEEEVHRTITSAQLFKHGETVGIAASGGKDSTVLAHVMKLLNQRYHYGLELLLLSVDEGITGYRDDSLETVKRNQQQYELPLKIVSYEELYGWTMDAIVKQVGLKNNCTFCGVFRRQALDRGAVMLKVDKICTGENTERETLTHSLTLLPSTMHPGGVEQEQKSLSQSVSHVKKTVDRPQVNPLRVDETGSKQLFWKRSLSSAAQGQ